MVSSTFWTVLESRIWNHGRLGFEHVDISFGFIRFVKQLSRFYGYCKLNNAYLSSLAHSARPGRKVGMLGWSWEGYSHWYFSSGLKNSMVRKNKVLRSPL